MTPTTRARHRAPRPLPPSGFTRPHPDVNRRVAVLASSGLLVTMVATSATAVEPAAPARAEVSRLSISDAARTSLATSPIVRVPADTEWTADPVTASSKPAPPPPPPPAPVAQTSRTTTRAAASTAPAGATPARAASAAPAAAVSSSAIVNYARQFLGTPYVWGGTTPGGFDCSGFTQYVFRNFGIELPRTSAAQATVGTRVSAADARPGDLVAWPGHVGIYTGDGNNIAARRPGTPLTEGPIYHSSPTFIRVG